MFESGSLTGATRKLIVIFFFAIVLVVMVGPGGRAGATIINVPADQPSIQAGIEIAMNGDTVLVAPGLYYENIDFRSKEIVVSSHFLLDQDPQYIFSTIIDGSQPVHSDSASCVRILCTGTQAPVIQGFSLTGGTGTLYRDPFESTRYNHGGGIATDYGAPVIRYNYIHHNISDAARPMGGGGMFLQRGQPVVTNNIIVHNTAKYGCGIGLSYATPVFRNNVIAYNSGGLQYGGGGIYQWQRGGLYENNTVVYNESIEPGGGIKILSAFPTIRNTIIRGNQAPSGEQLYLPSSAVTVEYCNIEGVDTGLGNINADPLFVGDWFYTPAGSPCIDAGSPWPEFNDPAWPSTPTSARWPSHGDLTNDMGAWGGPDRFPFELIAIHADPTIGWVPTEVNFSAESYYDAESWAWNFGDGDEATGQTPAHAYDDPGLYDIAVTVAHDGGEQYTRTREDLVAILADTLIGDNVASDRTEAIELGVEAVTFVPLDEIIIPVEYSGDLSLKYDSFSTVGCRTELFETQEIVDSSAAGKQLTIRLAGSSAMAAGRGPVLKLYFSHLVPAAYDQQTLIAFDGYAEFEPRFSGSYADYVPGTESGSITYIPCCQGVRGNANGDPDGKVNISDVSYLLAYMFGIPSGPPPPCPQEGNANGDPDEKTNISDVSYLLAYLFGIPSGPPPPSCPTSIVSVLEIPYGSSVVVDGNIVSDEWGDAAVRQFQVGSLIVVTVMAKHDGANLLVAYNYQFVQQEYLCVPEVLIDTENDKSENWMSDDWWFHVSATDCDANGTYNVWNGCSVVQPDWEGVPNFEMVPEPPRLDTFEVRIPFTKIGVTVGDTIGLALRAECVSSIYGYWPAGATIESPATWSIGILKP